MRGILLSLLLFAASSANADIVKTFKLDQGEYEQLKHMLDSGILNIRAKNSDVHNLHSVSEDIKKPAMSVETARAAETTKKDYEYYAKLIEQGMIIDETDGISSLDDLLKLFQDSYNNQKNFLKNRAILISSVQRILLSRDDLNTNAVLDTLNSISSHSEENSQMLNLLIEELK